MEKISAFFVENTKLTFIITMFLVFWGGSSILSLNSESYPAVSLATATVITPYDGASAEDIEAKITKPIEDEIQEVVGVKDVSSVSKSGLSYITVRVDMNNYDVATVMSEIQKAVENTPGLPTDLRAKPDFSEINSEEAPVYQIALLGPNDKRQRDAVAEDLAESLKDFDAVKKVEKKGYAERQFNIYLDHKKMLKWNVGVSEVISAVEKRNNNVPGGKLSENSSETLLRIEGKVSSADELNNVLIRSTFTGRPLLLRDVVSRIEDSKETVRVITSYNGQPATILKVIKKAGKDTIRLVNKLEERLELFKKTFVPKEVELVVFKNEAITVGDKLNVLSSNAVTGLALVILFLFIFLPFKIGVAACLSLPLAVLATFGVMPLFDMNLNSITVLALIISIGMLVDNSVVISENYTRLVTSGSKAKEAAIASVTELWGAITASALTTIAAFVPMLAVKGVMGKFIYVIPILVTASLLLSLLESFLLLPMRLAIFAKKIKKTKSRSDIIFDRITERFSKIVQGFIKARYLVALGFVGVLFASGFFMFVLNSFNLFPADETQEYLVRFETPNGTTVEKTLEMGNLLSKRIEEKLGDKVREIVGFAGEQRSDADDLKGSDGSNTGLLRIYVTEHTKYNVPYYEILKDLRSIKAPEMKAVSYEEVLNGPPVGSAIQSRFQSNDAGKLTEMVNAVKADMDSVAGVKDLKIDDIIGEDEIFVDINYEFASRLGLDVNSIGRSIRSAVAGSITSKLTLNNKDLNIMVRFDEKYRKNLDDLKSLKVQSDSGKVFELGKIASFRKMPGAPQIKRFKYKRSKTIVGNVDDQIISQGLANQKLKESYLKHSQEIKGVSMFQGGAAESSAESMGSLASASGMAVIVIFGLLVFMFNSYLAPVIIMTTIPLGLIGFSIAFWVHGRPISFLAMIGVIGLAGMIVNSGIVLISKIEQLKATRPDMKLSDLLIEASATRLRAVVVTSLTTICGLLPTAYGIGGQDAMLIPMTLAMAWGLTTGTILTLIWVPCFYHILEDLTGLAQKLTLTEIIAALKVLVARTREWYVSVVEDLRKKMKQRQKKIKPKPATQES